MSSLAIFILCAVFLLSAVLTCLLRPLLKTAVTPELGAEPGTELGAELGAELGKLNAENQANEDAQKLALFRAENQELLKEYEAGLLQESSLEQAQAELQQRVLAEVVALNIAPTTSAPAEAAPLGAAHSPAQRGARPSREGKTAIALFLLIPLAAGLSYLWLGNPAGLNRQNTQAAPPISESVTPQQIEAMVARLAARLQQNPSDQPGWLMLARSYKALGRFSESAEAYAKAEELVEQDASLLADYAEVLARKQQAEHANGTLNEAVEARLKRALTLNPNEPRALLMAGAAANGRGDFAQAIDYWTRLLSQLEPGSEAAGSVAAALEHARAQKQAKQK
ncbi:MAG: hypothetical protein V4623_09635 [Pseudomonadota bacterium]